MTAPVTLGEIIAGKYEVEEMVARGGMGMVVAARHRELGQKVAIKLMLRHLFEGPTQVEAEERFLRESRAAVRLRGENIARVFDVGRLDSGTPYIVMELLEGRDLEAHLKERRMLPVSEAVDYVMQACVGIAEAHKHGIVHRDLKPANLFLTTRPDGSPLVKVLDFGISKIYEAQGYTGGRQTNAAMVLGSPAYMSPEQVRSPKDVDVRADIWSLGIILYQCVSGVSPFAEPGSAAAIFAQILYEEPEPLERLMPRAPAGFCERVHRCLKKDAGERYQNVSELAAGLAPFATAFGRSAAASVHAMLGGPGTGLTPTGTLLLGDAQSSAGPGLVTEVMVPSTDKRPGEPRADNAVGTSPGMAMEPPSQAPAQAPEDQDALWAALQNISDTALKHLDEDEAERPRPSTQQPASTASRPLNTPAGTPASLASAPTLLSQAEERPSSTPAPAQAPTLERPAQVKMPPAEPPLRQVNAPAQQPAAQGKRPPAEPLSFEIAALSELEEPKSPPAAPARQAADGYRELELDPLKSGEVIPLAFPRHSSRGHEASGTSLYRLRVDSLLLARLVLFGAAAFFTVSLLMLGAQEIAVDVGNRFLYRTGHILFADVPIPWHALGGTILLVGVPLLAAVLLWWRFDLDATALACVWWLGEIMVFSSRYIADAQVGQLPPIAGELSDWAQVLGHFWMMDRAVALGHTVRLAGSVLMGIALLVMIYLVVQRIRLRR